MRRIILIQAFGIVLCFAGCDRKQPSDPVIADADIAGIDPDQKALPKDDVGTSGPSQPADSGVDKPVTDVTLDGSATGTEKMETVPANAAPLESKAPNASETSERVASAPIGSGPQTRFVKAWDLHIRTQPNRFSKITGHIQGGQEVRVSLHGGWAKLNDGEWIRARWLVKSRPEHFVGEPQKNESVKKPHAGSPRLGGKVETRASEIATSPVKTNHKKKARQKRRVKQQDH